MSGMDVENGIGWSGGTIVVGGVSDGYLQSVLQDYPEISELPGEGANLFQGPPRHRKTISNTTGVIADNLEFWLTENISVTPGQSYTYTAPSSGRFVVFFNAQGNYVSGVNATGSVVAPVSAASMVIANRYSDLWPEDLVVISGDHAKITKSIEYNGASRTDATGYIRAKSLPAQPSRNIFDMRKHIPSRAINTSTGGLDNNSAFWATDYIPVKPGVTYSFTVPETQKNWAYYDQSQQFISAQAITGTMIPPVGASFARGCNRYIDIPPESFVFVEGGELPVGFQRFVGDLAELLSNPPVEVH